MLKMAHYLTGGTYHRQHEVGTRILIFFSVIHLVTADSAQLGVRLVGGSGSFEGRVEVVNSNEWGSVCNELWDLNDAVVVCRNLGNRSVVEANFTSELVLEGNVPIWWHKVECTGSETRLTDCPRSLPTVDRCTHADDAGVVCSPKEHDLRLVGGNSSNEGRIEIYRESTTEWGAVCSDSTWGTEEANVACRHVGYPGGAMDINNADFGTSAGSAYLGNIMCDGPEERLDLCSGVILQLTECPLNQLQAAVVCSLQVPPISIEELSVGGIVGISLGFVIVIACCCLFSLNCKCREYCSRKQEPGDTDVYPYNSTTGAGDRTVTSNSQVMSGNSTASAGQFQPHSETLPDDPNLFLFAPKASVVPPSPGTEKKNIDTIHAENESGDKEPNGAIISPREDDKDETGMVDKGPQKGEDARVTISLSPPSDGDEAGHVSVLMTTSSQEDAKSGEQNSDVTVGTGYTNLDGLNNSGDSAITDDATPIATLPSPDQSRQTDGDGRDAETPESQDQIKGGMSGGDHQISDDDNTDMSDTKL